MDQDKDLQSALVRNQEIDSEVKEIQEFEEKAESIDDIDFIEKKIEHFKEELDYWIGRKRRWQKKQQRLRNQNEYVEEVLKDTTNTNNGVNSNRS